MTGSNAAAWEPSASIVEGSNLTSLMHARGFESFDALHAWSTSDVDGFWQTVIDALDIRFDRPPTAVRGSDDPTDPQWLPGAEFNIVASCLDHDADAVAVVHSVKGKLAAVTVGELAAMVGGFAAGYRAAGFVPGDRIAIAMPMTLESVVAYLGIVASGGVVVSIADSFAPAEIAVRLGITEPKAVVTQDVFERGDRVLPMYAKVVEADAPTAIVVRTDQGTALRDGDLAWGDFVVSDAAFQPVPRPAGAHTNILFSSGTTGEPKAIPWTHTTPLKGAMDGRYHHDIHAGDVVAWPTNLGWMMGPWLIYASLLNGATMALFDDAPTGRAFVDFVAASGVTMLGIVPSIAAAWRASGVLSAGDWSSVRVLSSTGEASNPDDYRWLMEAAGGVPVIEYCGGTEIGGGYVAGSVLHAAIPSTFPSTTLGLDLVLLDDDGEESDVGEVFLIPPSIGLSTELVNRDHGSVYYEATPPHDQVLRRHGDQFRRNPDGSYQALGRVDDTMNLGGIKTASADIEGAIGELDGIKELAAIASPTPGGGPDRLVVVVVPVDGSAPEADALRAEMQSRIRRNLNPLFHVHDVVVVDELPRTASQKVMRRTLRSRYEA